MGDPKENHGRSFIEKEHIMQEGKPEDSSPALTEADFRYDRDKTTEMPNGLQLNMEKTREEYEILYTRL